MSTMMTALPPQSCPPLLPSTSWTPASPAPFTWTEGEEQKLDTLARFLHCDASIVRPLLTFFLRYIHEKQRGLAVANLPEVLADFPVKWGYKKKRNDFLKLLIEMEFIYVKINFRPRIRAKTYALARCGLDLVERLARQEAPARTPVEPMPEVPPHSLAV
jgi:hypothetical protein